MVCLYVNWHYSGERKNLIMKEKERVELLEQGLCRGYLEYKPRYIDISPIAAEGKAKDM